MILCVGCYQYGKSVFLARQSRGFADFKFEITSPLSPPPSHLPFSSFPFARSRTVPQVRTTGARSRRIHPYSNVGAAIAARPPPPPAPQKCPLQSQPRAI